MSRMETEMFFVSQGFFSRFFEDVRTCPEWRLKCFCQSRFFLIFL